jgi:hypothetical protein
VVALVGTSGSALGPVEVLLLDCGLLLNVVGLGVLDGEVEVVEDGEEESDHGESDCNYQRPEIKVEIQTYRLTKKEQKWP